MARGKLLFTPEDIEKEFKRIDKKICCSLQAILDEAVGNIYTVNGSLIGDRTMELDFNSLSIENNGGQLLLIDPDNFDTVLTATDGLNGTSTLALSGDALGSNVSALLQAQLAGTIASINVSATNDLIEHNANKHQINVDGNVYLELDGSLLSSIISATDVTSQTSLQLTANSVGNDVKFILKADNGTNVLTIGADASTNSITHTAAHHTFDFTGNFTVNNGSSDIININNAGNEVSITATDEVSITATDSINGAQLSLWGQNGNSRFTILAYDDNSTNQVTIEADAVANYIIHTAGTHTFTKAGLGQNLLSLESGDSYIQAYDLTDQGNFSSGDFVAGPTLIQFNIIGSFNDGEKIAKIEGFADASSSSITHTADTHTFNAEGQDNGKVSLGQSFIRTFNAQDDGNEGKIETTADDAGVAVNLMANFNDGAKRADINMDADATTSTITHAADTHTFSVSGSFEVDGGQTGMSLDPANNQALVAAGDGTGNADLILVGGTGGNYTFTLEADDNVNQVIIFGDAVAESITYTAIHHNFPGLQDFADDAAAAAGGLAIGDLYRTGSLVKVRVA